jgi:hypothetical protein
MNETLDNKSRINYWQDTVDCWHRLPNKAFFLRAAGGVAAAVSISRQFHSGLRPHAVAV